MKHIFSALLAALCALTGCSRATTTAPATNESTVNHPDWSRNAVIYEVNTRQFTPEGTFEAFRQHLPRLKELGVDILWFMPIHPISELNRKGELGSYYAVADYKGVNPEFGTLDDFRKVVDEAHAAGMKVIIDWVPNHTGCDNAWVSEHPEYYKLNDDGEMYGPYDWTDVYQLDYSQPGTRAAMTDAMAYWIREAGIDGFRCDVASLVPVDFWNELRPTLEKEAGRPIFMLAEAPDPELLEQAFDMDYNWPMKDLFSEIAATAGQYTFKEATFPARRAADIDSLLLYQADNYPVGGYMMNMTSNHDLNSWEGTEFERLGAFAPAFAVLTYTLPGMPLIYTGQEAGLDRALEFFVKDKEPQWEPRNDYFTFYQRLNALKHSRPELAAGTEGGRVLMLPTASDDIIAFVRQKDSSATLTIANLGRETSPIFKDGDGVPGMTNAVDVFTGESVAQMPTELESGQYLLYTFNAEK